MFGADALFDTCHGTKGMVLATVLSGTCSVLCLTVSEVFHCCILAI